MDHQLSDQYKKILQQQKIRTITILLLRSSRRIDNHINLN